MKIPITMWSLGMCLAAASYAGEAASKIDGPGLDSRGLGEFLQKGYASAKAVLTDVRILDEREIWHDPDYLKDLGVEFKGVRYSAAHYIQKDGRERVTFVYSGTSPIEDEEIDKHVQSAETGKVPAFQVFDGQYLLGYFATGGTGDTETQRGRATLEKADLSLLASDEAPGKHFGFRFGALPADILASSRATIETEPVKINGLAAFKVSAPLKINKLTYNVVYWLSPERSCLPVKMELRETDGTLKKLMEATEFMKLEDGTWVTKSVMQRDYISRNGEPWEIGRTLYKIRMLEVKPELDESLFSTSPESLPVGTLLRDAVSGLEYVIGEGPVSDEGIQRIIEATFDEVGVEVTPGTGAKAGKAPQGAADSPNRSPQPLFRDKGVLGSENGSRTDSRKAGNVLGTGLITAVVGIAAIGAVAGAILLVSSAKRKK